MEIWKDIPGYEGKYQASTDGRIRSLWYRGQKGNIQILRPRGLGNYLGVQLGAGNNQYIHRLVALAFLPDVKKEVNHKNGDKHDNRLQNLEWVTASENKHHAFESGLRTNYGENHPLSKLSNDDVRNIRRRYRENHDTQWRIAEDYGISQQHVSDIISGRRWNRLE